MIYRTVWSQNNYELYMTVCVSTSQEEQVPFRKSLQYSTDQKERLTFYSRSTHIPVPVFYAFRIRSVPRSTSVPYQCCIRSVPVLLAFHR